MGLILPLATGQEPLGGSQVAFREIIVEHAQVKHYNKATEMPGK